MSPSTPEQEPENEWPRDPVALGRTLGFVPDIWQEQVLRSQAKRILLNWARQSGKSSTTALLALHTAGLLPDQLVLLVSPSLRQSGELFRKVVHWRDRLPAGLRRTLTEDNSLSCAFDNGSRIVSLPGSEATIRGFSAASLIIEDEAARVGDDLYKSIRPMLAVSGGRLILMSTPFGKRGHFFEEWEHGSDVWERSKVTAWQNERITAAFLQEEQHSLGEWWFKQEYECEFVEAVDQVFSYGDVMAALSGDIRPLFAVDAEGRPTLPSPISAGVKRLEL